MDDNAAKTELMAKCYAAKPVTYDSVLAIAEKTLDPVQYGQFKTWFDMTHKYLIGTINGS
jgi:hypothetical protein